MTQVGMDDKKRGWTTTSVVRKGLSPGQQNPYRSARRNSRHWGGEGDRRDGAAPVGIRWFPRRPGSTQRPWSPVAAAAVRQEIAPDRCSGKHKTTEWPVTVTQTADLAACPSPIGRGQIHQEEGESK